jgi:hypothetical protein
LLLHDPLWTYGNSVNGLKITPSVYEVFFGSILALFQIN